MRSRFSTALLLGVIAAAISMASASADPPPTPDSPQTLPVAGDVTVQMLLDCTAVPKTKEARAVMTANSLCGYGQPKGGGPQGESVSVSGNCGTLTFSFQALKSFTGVATVRVSVPWYYGPVTYGAWSGVFTNWTLGNTGSFSSSRFGYSTTWTDGTQVVTRPGFVTATLNSVVVNTAFLGPCYNASLLSESATIPY